MESDKVLRLIASVLSQDRLESAATAFSAGIASLMQADEASVGFDDDGHAVIAAMSRMELQDIGIGLPATADAEPRFIIGCFQFVR